MDKVFFEIEVISQVELGETLKQDFIVFRDDKIRFILHGSTGTRLEVQTPVSVAFDESGQRVEKAKCFTAIALDVSEAALLMFGRATADGWIQLGEGDSRDVFVAKVQLKIKPRRKISDPGQTGAEGDNEARAKSSANAEISNAIRSRR